MRKHGTLTRWNDDRGFGFITPSGGPPEVFVHVSAFPRDGRRPQVGELISFEVEPGKEGKPKAVRIMRPGQARASRPVVNDRPRRRTRAPLLVACGIAALGVAGYNKYLAPEPVRLVEPELNMPAVPTRSPFSCDGRTMCPQMHSCEEATYFLQNCPGTKMDGDGDGVPCEDQWC